jgi:hypothetical protein
MTPATASGLLVTPMPPSRSSFRRWMHAAFTPAELCGIAQKGAGAGFRKLRTTDVCVRLFDRHAEELWALVQQANARRATTRMMKQWIVWFAAEEVARRARPPRKPGATRRAAPRSRAQ